MKIINGYPPNHAEIEERFGPLSDRVIYTYGDTIYVPGNTDLAEHLIVHEEVHEKQQGDAVVSWWERYLSDDEFRLQQEIEAYREQYKYIQMTVRDGNIKIRLLYKLSSDLSGSMYGSIVTFSEARDLILDKK